MESAPLGLDPDEPQTPAWFSFLGLGLFLVGGLFFLIQSSQDDDAGPEPGAAKAAAETEGENGDAEAPVPVE